MNDGLTIARIAGIPIKIHPSWLLAVGLIVWSLAAAVFPAIYPGWSTATYWAVAAVTAILFFGSVVLHELTHSFIARARGLPVRDISLFVFGGVSTISGEAESPGDEFWTAIVGPLTSFVLAAVFFGLSFLPPGDSPVAAALQYLAVINLLLGLFNLVPGFPLDGGRVLRAAVWKITGSLLKATRIAVAAGEVVGFAIVLWGIYQAFSGNFLGGIWLVFMGWFLTNAAEQSGAQVVVGSRLRGLRVGQLMDTDRVAVDARTPIADFVDGFLLDGNLRFVPVLCDGKLCGILTLHDVRRVPRSQWPEVNVGQVMEARDGLATVTPDDSVEGALRLLAERDLPLLPVVAGDDFKGIISRPRLLSYLRNREALGLDQHGDFPHSAAA